MIVRGHFPESSFSVIIRELSASMRPFFLSSDQKAGTLVTLITVHFLLLCAHLGQTSGKTKTGRNRALPHSFRTSDPLASEGSPTSHNVLPAPIATTATATTGCLWGAGARKESKRKRKKKRENILPFFLSIRNSFYWSLSQNSSFPWSFLCLHLGLHL